MATTRILLDAMGSKAPANAPAILVPRVTSAGLPPAFAPLTTFAKLVFDQSTDWFRTWDFRLPADYLSGGSIFIKWSADVNAGNVIWSAGIAPIADGATNIVSGSAYNASDLSAAVAVPGTVGLITETSWALTVASPVVLQGGRLMSIFLGRRAGAAGDTAAGYANVWDAEFEYTS